MKVTRDTTALAVKAALCSVKGVKLEKIVSGALLIGFGIKYSGFGIKYNDVKEIIDNVLKIFEFSNKTPELDFLQFFNSGNCRILTVSEFTDSCYDLLVYKALEAHKEYE